jgi:hypothetical protein
LKQFNQEDTEMKQRLLITAISVALMGSASMVTNSVYADPTNPTAIEASCKNNADKKEWCTSQEQPTPSQDQNNTSGESNDSENNTSTDVSDENNTQDSSVTDNNSTEPEDTTSPTIEELFTQAEETGIFVSVETTIEWLVTNGISPEALTKEQRDALPIDWDSPQLPPILVEEQPTTDENEVTPTEDEVEPSEGEVVPTEDEVEPSEGEVVPTEGEVEPSEGEVVPTEGEIEPTEGEVIPTEGEIEPTEGEVAPTEGEVEPSEGEVAPTEGEVEPSEGEVVPTESEVEPSEGEVIPTEGEIDTQPIEPEDVEEPTYSPVVTEEQEQVIQTQLEAVDEIIVVDDTGNEILVPIEETEVVGEVVIPSASDEEGANASINGELLNVQVELGVAEATTTDEEQEPVILTTVTGLEMNAATTQPGTEVDTNNLITLQQSEAGNFILRIPNLKVGNLVVNVILRALTEKLDIYQVEEVTVAPEEVFNNDDSTAVEADDNGTVDATVPATDTSENVETTEPADEEVTEVVEAATS